jgi:hypothetical protein
MITDNTGAKKIEGTDNWRLIFDAHNDSVGAHSQAIQQIATVITGTTNNSGHAISANEYFIADGAKYKASQTIDTGATWAGKCTSVSDHDLINALNSKLTSQFNTQINDLNTPLLAGASVITFNTYRSTASNKPTTNDGFCITYSYGNGIYRQQIAFELTGEIYSRYYNNGTISAWVKRST